MEARLTRTFGVTAMALLAAALFVPTHASAQSRVFIPDFFEAEGTSDNFGEDVGEKLRDLMDEQVRFVSIELDEVDDVLKGFDMRLRDIDCLGARQLTRQIQADVVFCAHYTDVGNDMMQIDSMAFHPADGQPFYLETFAIDEDDDDEAAANIMRQFDAYVDMASKRGYCFEYSQLQQWEDAQRNCLESLEYNDDPAVRFQLAQIYREQERLEDALSQIDRVLEAEPYNSDALNTGGYVSNQLGQKEKALDYYRRYLEFNQDAAAVRQNLAYEMYQAGDAFGAMQLLEEGLGPDAEVGLYSYYGTFAFNAARERLEERGIDLNEEGATVPSDVRDLYVTAIESLERVYNELGDSASAPTMANVVIANIQLGQFAEAEAIGSRLTRTFPEEERIWVGYAQALQRQDKVDAALDAWTEVGQLNPEYPQLYERQANLLLTADRRDDAVPLLQRAVRNGFDASSAARMIFGDAYSKGMQGDRGTVYTIEGIRLAKGFDADQATTSMLNFFHGVARYQQGVAAAGPETLQSARASLPIFREARQLLEAGRGYASANDQMANLNQFLEAAAQYIEIQELLIERGR